MSFIALLAYLFFVFIRPQEFWGPVMGLPLVKVSLILAAIFLFAQKDKRFDAPQNAFLIVLMPVIVLAGALNGWIMGGINSLELFLTSILLPFLIIQNVISTVRKHMIVMFALLMFALVMVQNGIVQKGSELGIGWSGAGLSQGTRITYLGIFNDPNDLGMFFVMVLPFAFFFINRANKLLKLFFLVCAVGALYGVYLTNSRGALLGVLGLTALWFYLRYGMKKSLLFGGGLLPVALVVMSKFRAIDSEEESAEGRLEAWYEGFQMLFSHPFFGVGMDQFTEHHHLTSHNSFVLVFSELGLFGYFLWIGFLTATAYMLFQISKISKQNIFSKCIPQVESDIARTLLYSMAGYLITCFFLSRAYAPILYIYCAMITSVYYRVTIDLPPKERITLSHFSSFLWLAVFSSIILIYLVVRLLL